jgi:hypothetical protein
VFWRLLGIGEAADAYPIKLPRGPAWVKICLLRQELFDAVARADEAAPAPFNAANYDWIRQIWIRDQLDYFSNAATRLDNHAKWREDLSKRVRHAAAVLAFVLLLLVSLNIFGVFGPGDWFHMSREDWFHEVFVFAIGVLPGGAAILVSYCEKLGFYALARQYDRMVELFSRADEILPPVFPAQGADQAGVLAVLRELGGETMRDNAEWALHSYWEHRFTLPHS